MLYIRVDMNDTIATGHVMRCMSIADAAKRLGEDTTFILADEQAVELIEQKKYHCIVLGTRWDDMESEIPILEKVIVKEKIDKIIIDSYQVTTKYLSWLTDKVKTIYIDDLNSQYYPVNAIVCYANYWKKFNYKEKYEKTKLLLGTEYVPLRKEFYECGKKHIKQQVENLLLLSGGTDKYDILDMLLQEIDCSKYQRIDVICGRYYSKYNLLENKYGIYKNIFLHKAVSDIWSYMKQADIAISAGGTTLYELCAIGTPTISYAFVDNQLDNVTQFFEDGTIDYAGDVRCQNVADNVRRYLENYFDNQKMRVIKSCKMQTFVDGKGAERIVKFLLTF